MAASRSGPPPLPCAFAFGTGFVGQFFAGSESDAVYPYVGWRFKMCRKVAIAPTHFVIWFGYGPESKGCHRGNVAFFPVPCQHDSFGFARLGPNARQLTAAILSHWGSQWQGSFGIGERVQQTRNCRTSSPGSTSQIMMAVMGKAILGEV